MNVSFTDVTRAFRAGGMRALAPLLMALGAGAASVASPIMSLLILAALAAFAMAHKQRINLASLAGPALAALTVGALVDFAAGIGVLFVWRLIADARWSTREAARLARAEGRPNETTRRALAHAWLTPLYGLSLVAYTAPHMVAGLPLDLPHVPIWVPILGGGAAAVSVFDWALRRAAEWRLGELAVAPAAHLLAHHALFLLAFGSMLDVSAGVVALIAWRLAQARGQANFTAVP
jgi:hypothetical protein